MENGTVILIQLRLVDCNNSVVWKDYPLSRVAAEGVSVSIPFVKRHLCEAGAKGKYRLFLITSCNEVKARPFSFIIKETHGYVAVDL